MSDNLAMMSVGFLLSSPDDSVIWRGPKKNGMLVYFLHQAFWFKILFNLIVSNLGIIKQFLRDVDWGALDFMLIDTPPGTSDEHLSVAQYLSVAGIDGAIIVTTPQVKCMFSVCRSHETTNNTAQERLLYAKRLNEFVS